MLPTAHIASHHDDAQEIPSNDNGVLSETQLADRWRVHPKTLQRWRCEGRGPKYLKVSKHISYPIKEVKAFEQASLRVSTSERART